MGNPRFQTSLDVQVSTAVAVDSLEGALGIVYGSGQLVFWLVTLACTPPRIYDEHDQHTHDEIDQRVPDLQRKLEERKNPVKTIGLYYFSKFNNNDRSIQSYFLHQWDKTDKALCSVHNHKTDFYNI